jgi:hypothetical protein
MTNIKSMLFTVLSSVSHHQEPARLPPEGVPDRIHHDLIGLSDADAMWYYERRRWRGRD